MLAAALGVGQIGRQYGRAIDLGAVQQAAEDGRLNTLEQLKRYFGERDIAVHHRRVGLRSLERRAYMLPAIALLRNGNAVLLTAVRKGAAGPEVYYIDPINPGAPPVAVALATFGRDWTGEVLLVAPQAAHAATSRPLDWQWFWPELTRQRLPLLLAVVASLILHGLAFAPIIYLQIALDKVVGFHATQTLWVLTAGVMAALVINALMGYARDALVRHMAQTVEARLASDSFDKLLSLSPAGMLAMGQGRAEAALNGAVQLRQFVFDKLLTAVLGGTAILVLVPIMLSYSGLLTLVVLGFAVAMAASGLLSRSRDKRRRRSLARAEEERDAVLRETVGGMTLVKQLAQEDNQRRRWRIAAASCINARDERDAATSATARLNSFLRHAMTVAVIFVGVELILDGALSGGALIAVNLLAHRIVEPIVKLAGVFGDFERADSARRALAGLWAALPERTGSGQHKTLAGTYSLSDVTIAYSAQRPVIEGLSIDLPGPARIAVVGPSGAGKTTLLRALGGLVQPTSGVISVDGTPLPHIDPQHFRRQAVLIDESPTFFSGTIGENLRRPRANLGERELEAALAASGLASDLTGMPEGLETVIDEQASGLPRSRRIKLGLARALAVNPRVLLIDETIDALDRLSQLALCRDWSAIAAGRTLVLATHYLPLVVDFDLILVLDKGRLIASGRHHALLRDCALYGSLWNNEVALSARPSSAEATA